MFSFQIDREFSLKYPTCDSFLGKFSSFYAPRILQYVETYRPDLLASIRDLDGKFNIYFVMLHFLYPFIIFNISWNSFTDAFKALILVPELLPSPNYGKGKGKKVYF